ncbi:MAG: dihydrolipoyllysine-residue acetyltransferase [Nitrosomonadaceae bacterium]|nr:dihydrolipoyllysine-residue acetyltransferase [Nitrosomonadaceae bacterium]MDW7664089.1 dihydrolipoyllysine-residue acetyltransferase [Nitrosomonadaceae bacterium]MDW7665031.1 dihydrolipoyllysine-residue acetyltransferase [Nitrosomonadaceae bacterium]
MAEIRQVLVPDIGDFKDVPVIEVLVKSGDNVKVEDPLISLESDKATIEVPCPFVGVIKEINVRVGDKVSEGSLILTIEISITDHVVSAAPAFIPSVAPPPLILGVANPEQIKILVPQPNKQSWKIPKDPSDIMHAGPSVRRFARELGVSLNLVSGSGSKQRILKEDVQNYVKTELSKLGSGSSGAELNLLPWPRIDFTKFGKVELKSLSRIKKMSGANLHRNWVMIPHVTQFDEADITDLEVKRKDFAMKKGGAKITILTFLIQALVVALKKFPEFNASLDYSNDEMNLVIKNYYHIGFAVDSPDGLVVPVIRDVNQKKVTIIAEELKNLSTLAREGKLKPTQMQGASFTISSLGGIGGTAFTPIINAPEVAILGVSRASMKPVYRDGQFVPRLMLPLSLSYDHRVIDGASAARFSSHLTDLLANTSEIFL